jgi:hypothetical protein
VICFFDNHCNVDKNYFSSAVKTFESTGADAVHGVTVVEKIAHYHYNLSLEKRFWGGLLETFPPLTLLPLAAVNAAFSNDRRAPAYRIASGGHGAFVIRRSVWNEVGGYWDGFVGFGGEESYLDLKLALMDKTIWLDPNMTHEHENANFRGLKGYKTAADFLENNLMVANIIGGTSWAEKNAASSQERNVLEGGEDKKFYDAMLSRAIKRSADHAKWLASKRLRTLDEQLEKFRQEGVAGIPPSEQAVAFANRITGFAKGLERMQRTQTEQLDELNRKMATANM